MDKRSCTALVVAAGLLAASCGSDGNSTTETSVAQSTHASVVVTTSAPTTTTTSTPPASTETSPTTTAEPTTTAPTRTPAHPETDLPFDTIDLPEGLWIESLAVGETVVISSYSRELGGEVLWAMDQPIDSPTLLVDLRDGCLGHR